jgi:hypothetical protein
MSAESTPPPDWLALLGALLISLISGFISIAQRIVRGQQSSILWITSEFLAAILCGYLVYNVYPTIEPDLPKWLTMPILVALSAHIGGRSFQGLENHVFRKFGVNLDGTHNKPRN